MRFHRLLLAVAIVSLAGCGGIQSAISGQSTPTTTTNEGDTTAPPAKPTALVDISLTWAERPETIDSRGTLRIVVHANRSVAGEFLYINVSEGLSLVDGKYKQNMTLTDDDSLTTTLSVVANTGGTHQIHVYTSNLVPEEEGTMRASEVTYFQVGEQTNGTAVDTGKTNRSDR